MLFRSIVSTWNGIFAPNATPDNLVTTLHAAISTTLTSKDMTERIVSQGAEVYLLPSAKFGAMVDEEFAYWSGVVKKLGLQMEQ